MAPIRQVPRLPTYLPIRLQDGWVGEVLNMSAAGMRIRCIAVLPVGSHIDGVVDIPEAPVHVSGTVVWQKLGNFERGVPGEVGVELTEPSESYVKLVAKLFAESD